MFPECIDCRAMKALCGIDPCPLLREIRSRLPSGAPRVVEGMQGASPPSVFVGRHGHPNVMAGPMSQGLDEGSTDLAPSDPSTLRDRPLDEIAAAHLHLVRGRSLMPVSSAQRPDDILAASQEVAMAAKPVDLEVDYVRPVVVGGPPTFDALARPVGATGWIDRAEVTANPVVPRKVDSVVDESDLLATDAMDELTAAGIGEAHLQRLLSAGLLGRTEARTLVPTRWSITATDDTLGKRLFERLRDAPSIDRVEVYAAERLDNRFHVVLAPGMWAFQLLETWSRGALWTAETPRSKTDHEDGSPRTRYVEQTAGAYHAARLAVLESLQARGRIAATLVHRVIGPGYWAPVGVWLVRETVRDAMTSEPTLHDDLSGALRSVAADSPIPDRLTDGWFAKRGRQTRLDSF